MRKGSLDAEVLINPHDWVLFLGQTAVPYLDQVLHECLGKTIRLWFILAVVGPVLDPGPDKVLLQLVPVQAMSTEY